MLEENKKPQPTDAEYNKVTKLYLDLIIPHLRAHEAWDHLKNTSYKERKEAIDKHFNINIEKIIENKS